MNRIAIKLWQGMILLVALVLVLLWAFQIVFLDSYYKNLKISNIKKKAYTITKGYGSTNEKDIITNIDKFAYENDLVVSLIDSNGRTVYSTGNIMPMMGMQHMRLDIVNNVLQGKEQISTINHPRFNTPYIYIGIPVTVEGETIGALTINMSIVPVEETVSILKQQLLYISIVLTTASLIIAYIISKSFTKPIIKITNAAKNLAEGKYEIIEVATKDEIGDLAKAFNYMTRELSKTEQLRKELIANVSHELRTPLTMIQGYAETIKDVTGSNEEKRNKQLNIIIDESQRLSKIVNDVLELSRMQSGNFIYDKKNFLINKTISNIYNRFIDISKSQHIELILNNTDDTMVFGDESKIEQVIYNLLSNAFNHTNTGGKVVINSKIIEKQIRIDISDTGEGMDEEELSRIWDRYYKIENKKDKKIASTGLGLAIVKTILDAHNSKYGVVSEKGLGLTFWFELEIS